MIAFFSGVGRGVVLWLLFLLGIGALAGLGVVPAVVISGAISLALNHVWRGQQQARLDKRHWEAIAEDERVRMAVRRSTEAGMSTTVGPGGERDTR